MMGARSTGARLQQLLSVGVDQGAGRWHAAVIGALLALERT